MLRLITMLIVSMLLSLNVFAEPAEDFPKDGRYKKYPGVKPVIPLNTKDPTYDLWKTPRTDLSKGREPGPINVQRYPGAWFYGYTDLFPSARCINP